MTEKDAVFSISARAQDRSDLAEQIGAELTKLEPELEAHVRVNAPTSRDPLGFYDRAAIKAAAVHNDRVRGDVEQCAEDNSWLDEFVASFNPEQIIARFQEMKGELKTNLRQRIKDVLEAAWIQRLENLASEQKITSLLTAAKGKLGQHVIRMAGDASAAVEVYTGKRLRIVRMVEASLIAAISVIEFVAGFVPTQYHSNGLAGLAVAGKVMIALNGTAIMAARLMKRILTYGRARDGAREANLLVAYPLDSAELALCVFFNLFFFGGAVGLLYWRLIWSAELGEAVRVMAVLQVILALVLYAFHLYFVSGFRTMDVQKWRKLKATCDELEAQLDELQAPEEGELRTALTEEYGQERATLRSETLAPVTEFETRRTRYFHISALLASAVEATRAWYNSCFQQLNRLFSDLRGRRFEYNDAATQQIAEMLDARLLENPATSEFDDKLALFQPVVELPADDDDEFEQAWDKVKDELAQPIVIEAEPFVGLQFRTRVGQRRGK